MRTASSPKPWPRLGRRRWLGAVVAPLAAAALVPPARAWQAGGARPRWREPPFSDLAGARTATGRFFLRSHLEEPALESAAWQVSIEGLVARPEKLGFADLAAMPAVSRAVTFECSGNPPGGGLVGTADWRGVPLRRLLERAGIDPRAREIVLEGADHGLDEAESVPLVYARSIPADSGVLDDALVAWEMNGAPLPREHGFPVRVVVPGLYAMSHVKWLTRIRVVQRPFRGFYMTKRYFTAHRDPATGRLEIRPELRLKLKSQIARPVEGEHLAGATTLVAGAAWTGSGVVTRVEVSDDAGASWRAAELVDRPAPHVWTRWQYAWTPARGGAHTLVCRAFDDRGGAQPEAPDAARINRYGNNWYHRVAVVVQTR